LIYAFFIERTHSLEINCVFKLMTIKYCEGLLKKHPGTIMNDKKLLIFYLKSSGMVVKKIICLVIECSYYIMYSNIPFVSWIYKFFDLV